MRNLYLLVFILILASSCVSKKKYQEVLGSHDDVQHTYELLRLQSKKCDDQLAATRNELRDRENDLLVRSTELANERNRLSALEQQMEYFKSTNTNLLDRLADFSVINQAGAETIKKSLDVLTDQNKYIKDLTSSMQRKDSLNLLLAMNLKRSLSDVNEEDISIEVKKGVVYISLSDKMLFRSGSADIQPKAKEVLGKIAAVVNDHSELDILVEGHTDDVPIKTDCLKDNWDLSVKRATSVIRVLQWGYGVAPERMTAGGRSQFIPKASNETDEGRSLNRRTEIVILPKLDQFFQLLDPPSQ